MVDMRAVDCPHEEESAREAELAEETSSLSPLLLPEGCLRAVMAGLARISASSSPMLPAPATVLPA